MNMRTSVKNEILRRFEALWQETTASHFKRNAEKAFTTIKAHDEEPLASQYSTYIEITMKSDKRRFYVCLTETYFLEKDSLKTERKYALLDKVTGKELEQGLDAIAQYLADYQPDS